MEDQTKTKSKMWYIAGAVLIIGGICFTLWYFDIFNSSSNPSPGNSPVPGGSRQTNSFVGNLGGYTLSSNPTIVDNDPFIRTIDNQTRSVPNLPPVSNAVEEMNRRMSDFNSSGSSSRTLDRLNVLDQLKQDNGPPSPTGSTDSSETVTQSSFSRKDKGKGKPLLTRFTK